MLTILSAMVSLVSFRFRRRASLELEVVALRHQVAVLHRQRAGRAWLGRGNDDERAKETLYERLGGYDAIAAVANDLEFSDADRPSVNSRTKEFGARKTAVVPPQNLIRANSLVDSNAWR